MESVEAQPMLSTPLTSIRTLNMSLEWTIRCIRYPNAMNPMLLHILLAMAGLWSMGYVSHSGLPHHRFPHLCTTAEQLKTHAENEDADSIADAESIEQDDFSSDDEELA